MAVPAPERALRQQIVRLRALPRDDFDAIIDSLEQDQRTRILGLLAELEGEAPAAEASHAQALPPVVLPTGLSPWLAARVNGGGPGDETADPFAMTSAAHAALRAAAAALMPQPGARSPVSLLDRLWPARN